MAPVEPGQKEGVARASEYRVVVNHEEQYSIWSCLLDLPHGWKEVGVTGSKQHCLEYIGSVWKDIRPLSVRQG